MGGHGYRPKLNDGDYKQLSDGVMTNSGDIIKKNLYVSWRRLNASEQLWF